MKIFLLFLVYFFVNATGQRIAGGSTTTINEYPFATALLTNKGSDAFVQACGGTILTSSAILSAASCFYNGTVADPAVWWRARVGSTTANSGGTIYFINRITVHEAFSPTTLQNDIAVLRTTLNIRLQPNLVEAARIAGAGYVFQTNQVVWAIGWGVTSSQGSPSEQLRHVQVWFINQDTCASRYGSDFNVTNGMVCTGWLYVGVRGQCTGDTGSPLLDTNGAVVGVFSRTEGCADSYYPDINTRVSAYTDWIVAASIARN